MIKRISKNDGKWFFGIGITLIAGLWTLWSSDFSTTNLIIHIKFIYSLFLAIAIGISAYYIVFKLEEKKNVKKE